MPDQVQVAITGTAVHTKAQSACHAAPLDRVTPGAEEFTCRECGQPTEKVEVEHARVPFSGTAVHDAPEGSEG